jgi:hypothetical protein
MLQLSHGGSHRFESYGAHLLFKHLQAVRLPAWVRPKLASIKAVFDFRRGKTISYVDMKTTISSKGQVVLPAEFRQMDRIEPGQEFDIERLDRGDYRLVRRVAPRNEGAVDWLLACPYKDFFVPIDSESTDTL